MSEPARVLSLPPRPPQPPKRPKRRRQKSGPGIVRRVVDRLNHLPAPVIDAALAFVGAALISVGLGLIYFPAGIVAAGVALFYLGAWHR